MLPAPLPVGFTLGCRGDLVDREIGAVVLLLLIEAQPDVTQYVFTKAEGFWFVNDRNWKVQLGTSGRAGAMIERSRMAKTLRDQLVSRNIQPKLIDVRVIEAPYYVK